MEPVRTLLYLKTGERTETANKEVCCTNVPPLLPLTLDTGMDLYELKHLLVKQATQVAPAPPTSANAAAAAAFMSAGKPPSRGNAFLAAVVASGNARSRDAASSSSVAPTRGARPKTAYEAMVAPMLESSQVPEPRASWKLPGMDKLVSKSPAARTSRPMRESDSGVTGGYGLKKLIMKVGLGQKLQFPVLHEPPLLMDFCEQTFVYLQSVAAEELAIHASMHAPKPEASPRQPPSNLGNKRLSSPGVRAGSGVLTEPRVSRSSRMSNIAEGTEDLELGGGQDELRAAISVPPCSREAGPLGEANETGFIHDVSSFFHGMAMPEIDESDAWALLERALEERHAELEHEVNEHMYNLIPEEGETVEAGQADSMAQLFADAGFVPPPSDSTADETMREVLEMERAHQEEMERQWVARGGEPGTRPATRERTPLAAPTLDDLTGVMGYDPTYDEHRASGEVAAAAGEDAGRGGLKFAAGTSLGDEEGKDGPLPLEGEEEEEEEEESGGFFSWLLPSFHTETVVAASGLKSSPPLLVFRAVGADKKIKAMSKDERHRALVQLQFEERLGLLFSDYRRDSSWVLLFPLLMVCRDALAGLLVGVQEGAMVVPGSGASVGLNALLFVLYLAFTVAVADFLRPHVLPLF